MNIHGNARLTPLGREQMVMRLLDGERVEAVAHSVGVSVRTAHKWLARYRAEGMAGLADRSSRPQKLRNPTPDALVERVVALRRQRLTAKHIARRTNLSAATISGILKRAKLSRMADLEPRQPVYRYERAAPGELIHLDIKQLGRFWHPGHRVTGDRKGKCLGAGWDYIHVAIDDHSRIAFTQSHPDQKGDSAASHLKAAVTYYNKLGITIDRVMTDNGSCYKSRIFAKICSELGIKHITTKPYTPQTNGKAERVIQSMIQEWAYAQCYDSSEQRAKLLPQWTHLYNFHRPHGGINDQTPISRLNMKKNNLLRVHK